MMRPLGMYGYGYTDPRLASDAQDYTTADVRAAMPQPRRSLMDSLGMDQTLDRDTILPFARKDGQWQMAMPGFLADAVKAADAVGSSSLMTPYTRSDEARDYMTEQAGAIVGPQMAAGFMRNALSPRAGAAPSKLDLAQPANNAILPRMSDGGYLPPQMPQREFSRDYGRSPEGQIGSPLTHDIDGRPLVAQYVAGRRTVGGDDVGLSPREVAEVAERLAAVERTPRSVLGRGVLGDYNSRSATIRIADDLSPSGTHNVLAHELGHAVDDYGKGVPVGGAQGQSARRVFHDLAAGPDSTYRGLLGPENLGYKGRASADKDLTAEAIRAYLQDPNYIKTVDPNLAARILAAADTPALRKIIQFNARGVGPQPVNMMKAANALAPEPQGIMP